MDSPLLVIVGAGPGIGAALARRFAQEGYDVALVARDPERLASLAAELQDGGVTVDWAAADITDGPALTKTVRRFGERHGHIDVLHFNPSVYRAKDPLALTPDELLDDLRTGTAALLTAVQAAAPYLPPGARVTVTGSMAADRPSAQAASLGVQKAAVRNLVLSLDKTLAARGVRAMSLTVNGTLSPGTAFSPDRVADALCACASTSDEEWRPEVSFDG